jgi:hypothetical protein
LLKEQFNFSKFLGNLSNYYTTLWEQYNSFRFSGKLSNSNSTFVYYKSIKEIKLDPHYNVYKF